MASELTFSVRSSSSLSLHIARLTLMSVVLWSFMAGSTFATGSERAMNAKPPNAALLGMPLSFEANEGQTDSQVKFLSHGDGYSLFLTSNEAVFTLRTPSGVKVPPTVFRMKFAGASRRAQVYGAEKLPGAANYFIGTDPTKWRSGISGYGKVNYRGIYPGVDAVFYGNQRQLEYDFVVAPGADPRQISLVLTGAAASLDAEGNVMLKLADGDLTLKKPLVYQETDGVRKTVDAGYAIAGSRVRFHLGKYDRARTLVIDPVFTYLTYLGGSGPDQIGVNQLVGQTGSPAQALAVDSAGDVYVTGNTTSTNFPLAHSYQSANKGSPWAAFVSALNPSGTALLFSTYLGGTVYNAGTSVAWDSHDNSLYVIGTTNSPDFPITAGAFQPILSPVMVNGKEVSGGNFNAFVAKFSAAGQLTNSTFLGGYPQTDGFGIATDSQGRAYVVGITVYNCISGPSYECFPTTPGAVIPAGTISTNGNGFVSVFDPNLSTLLYSTLLGDPNGAQSTSEAFGVTVDSNNNFYVVGVTGSASLPTTPGAYQPKLGVANSIPLVGFAAKFGPVRANGASLTYLTYLEATGTGFGDFAGGVVADSQGNAYIGGYTNSPTFPVTTGAYSTPCPLNGARLCPAAFVTKLNPAGTGLIWSALVEPADFFSAIQLDAQGNVYVAGHSTGAFQGVNSLQPGLISGGFVSELDPTGSTLLFSSVVGASAAGGNTGNSTLSGLAVDSQGNVYVAGNMNDATLPTTPGVVQPAFAGGQGSLGDGLIAKINLASATGGQTPIVPANSVVNNASFADGTNPVAPGTIVAIFGSNLNDGSHNSFSSFGADGKLLSTLGGASVTFSGIPAPMFSSFPGQLNVQVPLELAGSASAQVVVTVAGQSSIPQTVPLGPTSPGIFTINNQGSGQGIIQISNTTIDAAPTGSVTGARPANPGEFITIYATGLGAVNNPPATGAAASGQTTVATPLVSIGGVPANVSFSGLAPGFVGLYQVNIQVPTGVPAGSAITVELSTDGKQSNPVTMAVAGTGGG